EVAITVHLPVSSHDPWAHVVSGMNLRGANSSRCGRCRPGSVAAGQARLYGVGGRRHSVERSLLRCRALPKPSPPWPGGLCAQVKEEESAGRRIPGDMERKGLPAAAGPSVHVAANRRNPALKPLLLQLDFLQPLLQEPLRR